MSNNTPDDLKDRLKKIVNQFAGNLNGDDETEMIPEYGIKGSGYLFCFYPSKRMYVKVNRGTKVFIVDETLNDAGQILIYTFNGELVEIDPDELEYTGFD